MHYSLKKQRLLRHPVCNMKEKSNTQVTEQLKQFVTKHDAVSIIWTHLVFSKDDAEQR